MSNRTHEPEELRRFFAELPVGDVVACKQCKTETWAHVNPCWECTTRAAQTLESDELRARAFERTRAGVREHFERWSWIDNLDSPLLRTRVQLKSSLSSARAALSERFIAFYGPATGVGKTTLAVAMLLEWSKKSGKFAMIVPARKLAVEAVRTPLGKEPELLAEARKAPMLVLDDLGNDREIASTDVVDLICDRHDSNLPLWVTTAYNRDALAKRYGEHVARRLFGESRLVQLGPALKAVP